MKIRKNIIILLLILFLGTFLRFYQLGSVPLSPNWDEVALAYEAHSLATTGRDEFGKFMPLILRSFGDYKPAVYVYLAIPFIQLFDMTTFAVRLPSAIMGVIGILGTYLLVRELFVIRDKKNNHGEWIALLAAFSLAISPWHIQFSRIAFESNVGLTVNILLAFCFLKGLQKPWLLLVSFFLAGINLSVYQSERVFTPLLVFALIVIFWKEFFALPKKYLTGAVIVGLIAISPIAIFFANDQNAFLRIKSTSVFSNQTEVLKKTTARLEENARNNDVIGQAFDNRRVTYGKEVINGYLAHFDPNWLFMHGDMPRHHAPRVGLLYIVFLSFILYGIYQLVFGAFDRRTKLFVFAWFLMAPIPASITADIPHAVRTLNFLPTYDIFTAIGITSFVWFVLRLKHKFVPQLVKYAVLGMTGFFLVFNFIYHCNQYFVQQNYFYSYDWQYGYEKAIPVIEQMKKNYKKVIVSDKVPMDKSYMFFLFYLKIPPQQLQKINASLPQDKLPNFDKYEFKLFNWEEIKDVQDILVVGTHVDFPREIKPEHVIYHPNGESAILIVDPEKNK